MGYSISKVVEMLQSEHIRNLPTEIKRPALLMALEAADIQIDELLQDATLRQSALNSYEATQRKQREEYEARKSHDNCALRAEMDRLAAEYAARIKANVDEVESEKDAFREWQAKKQHEAQQMAEAVLGAENASRGMVCFQTWWYLGRPKWP
jgi:regulator of protease activity HflC (stomatin/prohibitin superfamily)